MKLSYSITFILLILTLSLQIAHAAQSIDVIVNSQNSISSIKTSELNDFFMKRERKWPNGDAVRFFDFRDENQSRNIFLKTIVKKTSREIELFWIGEKIYTGNIAPIQVTTDSMMTSMVSRFPGGIGYVSSKLTLPKTVKRIKLVQD